MSNAINLKVDSRGRITIGSLFKGYNISSVKAYFNNTDKTIILEPFVEVSLKDCIKEEVKNELLESAKHRKDYKKFDSADSLTKYLTKQCK
ncbi:MAG: hypothetical protein J6C50_01665 [Rickettsiales bacterium]|nr:hypothetical protein [Rickettsiales bacterium]